MNVRLQFIKALPLYLLISVSASYPMEWIKRQSSTIWKNVPSVSGSIVEQARKAQWKFIDYSSQLPLVYAHPIKAAAGAAMAVGASTFLYKTLTPVALPTFDAYIKDYKITALPKPASAQQRAQFQELYNDVSALHAQAQKNAQVDQSSASASFDSVKMAQNLGHAQNASVQTENSMENVHELNKNQNAHEGSSPVAKLKELATALEDGIAKSNASLTAGQQQIAEFDAFMKSRTKKNVTFNDAGNIKHNYVVPKPEQKIVSPVAPFVTQAQPVAYEGDTPLHRAVRAADADMINGLLADVTSLNDASALIREIKNKDNQTVFDLAITLNHWSMVTLLTEHLAKRA